MRLPLVHGLLLSFAMLAHVAAAQTWCQALALMPLTTPAVELNRTNCVRTVLGSFTSNGVVKAVIFLPGATDEFYFFRRATARLSGGAPSLMDAIQALTNQTLIRATFNAPFLLLHTAEESTVPKITINDPKRAKSIQGKRFQPYTYFDDRDWDQVQPLLRDRLGTELKPWRFSWDSWHFYRHSYAGWNLDLWEALQATSLAGGTQVIVNRRQVVFQGPPRAQSPGTSKR
jgi:hypothetical protein